VDEINWNSFDCGAVSADSVALMYTSALCGDAEQFLLNYPGWAVVDITALFECQIVTNQLDILHLIWEPSPDLVFASVGFSEWHGTRSSDPPKLVVYY
jgi:hypothetical protein